jgi:hypothetical protein
MNRSSHAFVASTNARAHQEALLPARMRKTTQVLARTEIASPSKKFIVTGLIKRASQR